MLIPRQAPVAWKIEVKRDHVVISALKQSARGTRYIAGSVVVPRDGGTKKDFETSVLAALAELSPPLPSVV